MADPQRRAVFLPDRDAIEASWLTDPPTGQEAFDAGIRALDEWWDRVNAVDDGKDVRPWYARRYWSKRSAALSP